MIKYFSSRLLNNKLTNPVHHLPTDQNEHSFHFVIVKPERRRMAI